MGKMDTTFVEFIHRSIWHSIRHRSSIKRPTCWLMKPTLSSARLLGETVLDSKIWAPLREWVCVWFPYHLRVRDEWQPPELGMPLDGLTPKTFYWGLQTKGGGSKGSAFPQSNAQTASREKLPPNSHQSSYDYIQFLLDWSLTALKYWLHARKQAITNAVKPNTMAPVWEVHSITLKSEWDVCMPDVGTAKHLHNFPSWLVHLLEKTALYHMCHSRSSDQKSCVSGRQDLIYHKSESMVHVRSTPAH